MMRKIQIYFCVLAFDPLPAAGFLPSSHWRRDAFVTHNFWEPTVVGNRQPSEQSLRAEASSSCPFAKAFPRYKIQFTKVPSRKKESFQLPFISDFQNSMSRSKLEKQFKDSRVQWVDNDVKPLKLFATLWRLAAELEESSDIDRSILCLPQSSRLQLVQHWIDILNWLQTQEEFAGNPSKIEASLYEADELLAVEVKRSGNYQVPDTTEQRAMKYDPSVLNKRTQAWVKRILVDQGICPFTKSVRVSGQGLGDLGIPVARIHYCSSNARLDQINKLMADSWQEILYMLESGPSGKDGISSILLAAPEFDVDFDLWSGCVFAMLEAGVVVCGLEKQIGVVCFHPYYATPDGSSFPGFGHMHSVPRLQKWLKEQDPSLEAQLSQDEIAAGGAWQRRTPHATINVLRADQLEAAEGKRVTGELYTENIRKLVGKPEGIGSDKLMDALEQERALQ